MKALIKLFLLALLLITGCFPFDEGKERQIIGRYYVRGDANLENVHLSYEDRENGKIGLVSAPVVAVGHNKEYLIIEVGGLRGGISSFYILKIIRTGIHADAEKAITGPLSQSEFHNKLAQLNLTNSITFDQAFKADL